MTIAEKRSKGLKLCYFSTVLDGQRLSPSLYSLNYYRYKMTTNKFLFSHAMHYFYDFCFEFKDTTYYRSVSCPKNTSSCLFSEVKKNRHFYKAIRKLVVR